VVASHEIPPAARDWECSFCRKGLPFIDQVKQRQISIRHHWKTDHPDQDCSRAAVTIKRLEAHRNNSDDEPGLIAGRQKKSASQTKRHAANRDVNRNIHQLVAFEPHWPTWKKCLVDPFNHLGPFFTRMKC